MVSGPSSERGAEDIGQAPVEGEGEDSLWLRSFVRTQPGKTYRVDAPDDAHEEAAREALTAAARTLTDEVVRGSDVPVTDHTPTPGQSS